METIIKVDEEISGQEVELSLSNNDLNNPNFIDLYIKDVLECTVLISDLYHALHPYYVIMEKEYTMMCYEEHCNQQRDEIYRLKNLLNKDKDER